MVRRHHRKPLPRSSAGSYWLQSEGRGESWGPFKTEAAAWRYLFGRTPLDAELQLHKDAGWFVGTVNKYRNRNHGKQGSK